jgi:hypothetical protein
MNNQTWPTCDKCSRVHNPSVCFLEDEVALNNFLKGKPQDVKDYWKAKVLKHEAWKARKEAEHQAFLERDARRKEYKKKHEEYLACEAIRQAKRKAREAEVNRLKTEEDKMAAHRSAVNNMIRNGGGFRRP